MRRALSLYLPRCSIDLARRRIRLSCRSSGAGRHDQHDQNDQHDRRNTSVRRYRTVQEDGAVHRDHEPLVLIALVREQELVVHAFPQAQRLGITPGMSRSHAHALAASAVLHVLPHEPQGDLAALHDLARRLSQRFSPIVSVDPPDGILLDITGCGPLFHGEHALRRQLLDALGARRFHARAAIASTFTCARAVARFGVNAEHTIPAGDERGAIAPLPLAALDIDAHTVDALEDIGLTRIEHLFALPRAELARRFGAVILRHLDQALGQAMESIQPVPHETMPAVAHGFTGGVTQPEALEHVTRTLLHQLLELLHQREGDVRRLELELQRLDLPPAVIGFDVSAPTRNPRHLWTLLQPKLSAVHLGHGVEHLDLRAPRISRLPHRQHEHWRDDDAGARRSDERAASELIDTLVARLGAARVLRLAPMTSHQPEACAVFRTITEAASRAPSADPLDVDRPSRLFDPPEPIDMHAVTDAGHPAAWMHRGVAHRARTTVGPETIAPDWWHHDHDDASNKARRLLRSAGTRDYFITEDDDGLWHWLCRVREHDTWWAHGDWA
ncbi:MAG: DNA polymerase Y family protein [Phycisphaerales bacterium]|nr:DNA polymerase Y family protein [Phycisphaerales bacterium]